MATKINIGTGSGGLGVATFTLRGLISLITSGEVINTIVENINSQANVQEVLMAAGLNTIPIPNKSGAVLVIPLKDADFSLDFRGTGGAAVAACHTFHAQAPFVLTFPSTLPANLYLNWGGVKFWEFAVTITNATDLVNFGLAHGIANATRVMLTADVMPAPLESKVIYYKLAGATGNDLKLALTPGGAAIDLTTDGTNVKFYTMCQYKLFWV